MGKFKEIGGATLNYGLGKFIPQLIGFFLIPVYTVYLTPADYGIVELSTSFLAFVMIFMRIALPGSVARFYYDHKEGTELRDYVTTVYWSLMLLSLLVGGIAAIVCYYFIDRLVPGLPFWPYVLILLVTGALNTTSDIQKRLIQARKQSRYSAMLSIVTALISICIAIVCVVVFHLRSLGFVIAGGIAAFVFFVQAQFYLRKDLGGRFSFTLLKPSLRYALNIVPSHLVMPFSNLFSRSLLAGVSLAAVGTFSLASRFMLPLTMLVEAFNTSYAPLYFEARKADDADSLKKLQGALNNIWIVSQIIFVGASLFMPPMVRLITPANYHEAAGLIPYMAIAFPLGVFTYFVQAEVFYSKQTLWISIYATFKVIINLVLAYFLVPLYGAAGLVMVLLGDNIYATIFWTIVSNRIHKITLNLRTILYISIVSLLCTAACIIFNHLVPQTPLQLSAAAFVFSIYAVIVIRMKWLNLASATAIFRKKKKKS